MALNQYVIAVTVAITLGIGLVVLLANPGRHQNRAFFTLATVLSAWGFASLSVHTSTTAAGATAAIRLASFLACPIPLALHLLFRSISCPEDGLATHLFRIRYHLFLVLSVVIVIFSPLFLREVEMPGHVGALPIPEYGPGVHVLHLYIGGSLLALILRYAAESHSRTGIQRAELQFILMGAGVATLIAIVTQMVLPFVTQSQATQQYGPAGLLVMNLIIAYGVATRRMLDIPTVLQRLCAYAILGIYLTLLYLAVYYSLRFFARQHGEDLGHVIHFVAAIAVAFSMSPMYGLFQRVARRLFIGTQHQDIGRIVRVSRERFATLSTIEEMLAQLRGIIAEGGLDPESIHLLIARQDAFIEQLPDESDKEPIRVSAASWLATCLQHHTGPIALETVTRGRLSPELRAAIEELQKTDAVLALGLFSKRQLRGMLLLARRQSGRIYSSADQDALQLVCDQMANALENTQLYTELQNSKLYSEIIVDNLVSGVIAVDEAQRVTTLNREAQRITGLDPDRVLHQPVDVLPAVLAEAIRKVFENQQGQTDTELTLQLPEGEDEVPIRLSSSLFRGHHGHLLGALIVFSDLTRVKALESQVRRSDRLASIGTLSAGMAHEIKNPLVSIKTFTQLLPERYMDEDFRLTFSELISHEVDRIDSIVNQLLHFSRPSKPHLEPASLHQILRGSLRLLSEQMRQKGIHLVADIQADDDRIQADLDLLSQAVINFLLNAIQSMSRNGTLTVSTRNTTPLFARGLYSRNGQRTSFVSLDIQDTGEGIPEANLPHVFDPFYTTKEDGTGLGLSVSHGIIAEHHGIIDVESEPGVGTVFHLYFPIHKEAAATP